MTRAQHAECNAAASRRDGQMHAAVWLQAGAGVIRRRLAERALAGNGAAG